MVGRILDRLDLAQRNSLRAKSALTVIHSVVMSGLVPDLKRDGKPR